MRTTLFFWMLLAAVLGCRRRVVDEGNPIGPGTGTIHLYVEEQGAGDSVDVALFFTSGAWGEGSPRGVDSVAVNGTPLSELSTGLYSVRLSAGVTSFSLFFRAGNVETTLNLPVDTLTPPAFLSPSVDTTVQPGDSFQIRLSRVASLRILQDTVLLAEYPGVETLRTAFNDPGRYMLDAFLLDTLFTGSIGDGTVGVRTGGQTRRIIQVGSPTGGYTLMADTSSPGCSGAAPCFSWTPADSLEAFSVFRKTGTGEELWWDIEGNPDPQDTTRVIPFGPPVVYGQADPLRYRVRSGPVDTLHPGETYRLYGFAQGSFVLLGEYSRP